MNKIDINYLVTNNIISDIEDLSDEIITKNLHDYASNNNYNTYIDHKTGYSVLTEHYLKNRNKCCGNKCRHCPYNHINVKK